MVPASNDPAFLKALSRSIYQGMASADPQAIWVLQGWPFLFREDFWQPDQIRAVLDGVPQDRLLLLDLYADERPQWSRTESFYGRPWVWCMLHSFGGRPGLFGNLQALAHELPAALNNPDRGQLVGIGISTEAIETNPVLYDLLCEMTWHRQAIDLPAWTTAYAARRYGQHVESAAQAWSLLRESVYDADRQLLNVHGSPKSAIGDRPTLNLDGGWRAKGEAQLAPVMQAWELLLQGADVLHSVSGYQRDLVDVALQALTHIAEALHVRMVGAYEAGKAARFRELSSTFLQIIHDMDRLAATRGEYLLGRWIASALRHGDTAAEQAHLEWNARNLITLWGVPDSILHDYSSRYWAGLIGTFYAPRWELFVRQIERALTDGTPFDEAAFEREVIALEDRWTRDTSPLPIEPVGDSVQLTRALFASYQTTLSRTEAR
jgi:alpha-N-acetylglucosaminidase